MSEFAGDLEVCCPSCGETFVPKTALIGKREPRVEAAGLRLASRLWGRVSPDSYEVWIVPLVLISINRERLLLGGEKHIVDWGAARLAPVIKTVALELAGHPMEVEFVVARPMGARTLGDLLTDGVATQEQST